MTPDNKRIAEQIARASNLVRSNGWGTLINNIESALNAERQRCAALARNWADKQAPTDPLIHIGRGQACRGIGAEIEKGK